MNTYLKKFVEENFKYSGKALDLGAGDFSDVEGLKKLGWQCEGVDIKIGIDLEKEYISDKGPFDLVYSNYLIHKLKSKQGLIQTIYDNLKPGGWLFIHTFDQSDENSRSGLSAEKLRKLLLTKNLSNIVIEVFDYYDKEEGHKHWHKILQVVAQKTDLK